MLNVADLWLDRFLRGVTGAYSTLSDTLNTSMRFTSQVQCLSTGVADDHNTGFFAAQWRPTTRALAISGLMAGDLIEAFDVTGRSLAKSRATSGHLVVNLPAGAEGIVIVKLRRGEQTHALRIPVID